MRVIVAPGHSLDTGRLHLPGAAVDLDDEVAAALVERGIVSRAPETAKEPAPPAKPYKAPAQPKGK